MTINHNGDDNKGDDEGEKNDEEGEKNDDKGDKGGALIPFPQSRVKPSKPDYTDLGLTALAKQLGLNGSRLSGHWCGRCNGMWFGTLLEVECPVCGNRQG